MAKKKTGYRAFLNLTNVQRTMLYRRANRGNKQAQAQLIAFTRQLAKETNKRMLQLEKKDFAYYHAYNNIYHYTFTMYDGKKRLKLPNYFHNKKTGEWDWSAIKLQNEQATKFLKSNYSKAEYVNDMEQYRIDKLIELGSLPEEIRQSKNGTLPQEIYENRGQDFYKNFLRFLGSEEMRTAINEYGTSDILVEMIWVAYSEKNYSLQMIASALDDYLDKSNDVTFDEAMERIGIKIEDYRRRKPTS